MKTIGLVLILIPLTFFVLMYIEGGLMGVYMYVLYLFATAITTICPYIGYKLIRKTK